MIGRFLAVARVEAASYMVLIAASVAHRVFGLVNLVPYAGLVHGVIFLIYLTLAFRVRGTHAWDTGTMIVIVLAAVVPAGTLLVERHVAANPTDPDLLHGWIMGGSRQGGPSGRR